MASLLSLPTEMIQEIGVHLAQDSLSKLGRTSTFLFQVLTPQIYRSVSFSPGFILKGEAHMSSCLAVIASPPSILSESGLLSNRTPTIDYVEEFIIGKITDFPATAELGIWDNVIPKAIRSMKNLKRYESNTMYGFWSPICIALAESRCLSAVHIVVQSEIPTCGSGLDTFEHFVRESERSLGLQSPKPQPDPPPFIIAPPPPDKMFSHLTSFVFINRVTSLMPYIYNRFLQVVVKAASKHLERLAIVSQSWQRLDLFYPMSQYPHTPSQREQLELSPVKFPRLKLLATSEVPLNPNLARHAPNLESLYFAHDGTSPHVTFAQPPIPSVPFKSLSFMHYVPELRSDPARWCHLLRERSLDTLNINFARSAYHSPELTFRPYELFDWRRFRRQLADLRSFQSIRRLEFKTPSSLSPTNFKEVVEAVKHLGLEELNIECHSIDNIEKMSNICSVFPGRLTALKSINIWCTDLQESILALHDLVPNWKTQCPHLHHVQFHDSSP